MKLGASLARLKAADPVALLDHCLQQGLDRQNFAPGLADAGSTRVLRSCDGGGGDDGGKTGENGQFAHDFPFPRPISFGGADGKFAADTMTGG